MDACFGQKQNSFISLIPLSTRANQTHVSASLQHILKASLSAECPTGATYQYQGMTGNGICNQKEQKARITSSGHITESLCLMAVVMVLAITITSTLIRTADQDTRTGSLVLYSQIQPKKKRCTVMGRVVFGRQPKIQAQR